MKKLFILALCTAALCPASAQKANVDAAKKLAGKVDKIEEARAKIAEAISNPETSNQANTYLIASEVELKAYDSMKKSLGLNAQNTPVDDIIKMDRFLLSGYPYLLKTKEVAPNDPKGEKAAGEADKKLAKYVNDYFEAGADLYGKKLYYPEAYNAFVIYGDIPGKVSSVNIPDSVRSTSYYNAGLSGWAAKELVKAAEAFKKARATGYDKPEAYIYELACWQNLMQNDSTLTAKGQKEIFEISDNAYKLFGLSQPVFLNNMINVLVEQNKYDDAITKLNQLINEKQDAALYGLRGYVYDRMEKDNESVADYLKAIEFADADYETLKNAGKKIFRVGTERWNKIEGTSPEANAERTNVRDNFFKKAQQIAERAKKIVPEGQSTDDLDYLLESVAYSLESLR